MISYAKAHHSDDGKWSIRCQQLPNGWVASPDELTAKTVARWLNEAYETGRQATLRDIHKALNVVPAS
jgi:hypothetical protein